MLAKDLMKRCLRCGHRWQTRIKSEPRNCPRCKSPMWDKERAKGRRVTA